jgi:hypothetical protein
VYCQNCGSQIDDSATHCPRCGESTAATSPYASPGQGGLGNYHPAMPTYLVQAILVTIFCCMPFGIVAIVYAAQVEGKQNSGDYDGALRSSDTARRWCWYAVLSWVAIVGVGLVIQLLFLGLAMRHPQIRFH